MRCNDPRCGCQPAQRRLPRKLRLFLHGAKLEQKCALHQPGAELDVVFDLVGNVLILQETIKDPERIKTAWTLTVHIDCSKMHFLNLRGTKDGSLQLSLQLHRSVCFAKGDKMRIKEKFQGFAPLHLRSRLFDDFYSCDWTMQRIELFLPKERIRGWKTVALILKTFNEISAAQWCHLVNIVKPPPVAVLYWRGLGEYLSTAESKKDKGAPKAKKAHVSFREETSIKLMHRVSLEESQLRILSVLVAPVPC